jgi:hypothetical protein
VTAVQPEPARGIAVRSWTRWLPVFAIGALVLAVSAGIYRHEERDSAHRAAARSVVLSRETDDLEQKVEAARAKLAETRSRLRAEAPNATAMLKLLDQLNANHSSMSAIVRDQDGSSSQLIGALAAGHDATYNRLADRFTASTATVDALAAAETRLRDALVQMTCGANCGAREAAAHLSDG